MKAAIPPTLENYTQSENVLSPKVSENSEATTPMLKQYHSIKAEHKDCILLFRLGDFYEMFYEDAKVVSKTLDLVLTARGKGPNGKVPMCGFPHHAAPNYIKRLVKDGFKVALCDQTEDPATAKGIVKRDVTRIITSGTYLDEDSSDARFLACLFPHGKTIGIAFCDPTSGTIYTNQYPFEPAQIIEIIGSVNIYECIFPLDSEQTINQLFSQPALKLNKVSLTPIADWSFNKDISRKFLCDHFSVANLHGFSLEPLASATSATGALLEYLKQMNKQPLKHIDKISLYSNNNFAIISPAAFRGLELNSLIEALNQSQTPMGKRLFRDWFIHPLKETFPIVQRQKAIKLLKENMRITNDTIGLLNGIGDIEKNLSRLSCGYVHPKDLLAIRSALIRMPELKKEIAPVSEHNELFTLKDLTELRSYLENTLNEDVPLSNYEGKVIRDGVSPQLDDLRALATNGRNWLKNYQQEEIKSSGINSLKIGYNKIFGYYIEITKSNLNQVPETYIRKQTLVNAERFITPKLKEYEEKILSANESIQKIENEIIEQAKQTVISFSLGLHQICHQIATLDVLCSLTLTANQHGYVCPEINEKDLINIVDGRHPVVEKTIDDDFTANDTLLDCNDNHLHILTGPNMSGKSTYIRQCAILVIMAQTGSFIPAASAKIGIVDRIFTRIGAHDDISKGQSTFMVEMNETADILNNLSNKSLVVLDEIGRGTSTYDGLSLAWALAEHLHKSKVRTLFATHFHELTALAQTHNGIKNYNVSVKEWKDKIIFLHKIVEGGSDDSYGIYVAKLAGIPHNVIDRARSILTTLELKNDLKGQLQEKSLNQEKQADLFNPSVDPTGEKLIQALNSIDINHLTPLEALNKLSELKKAVNDK